ncbi:MAG: hypothetical protein SCAL_001311 [Candidatus Syntrophoarchaeum caldarius]|uniref:Uncharacterized protein n=1 Tax=Candidatus Syntropharchaeum caldarium TaxID=1838285 RepID=A0A1F2P844_9EURY|nr:MAG: hypothetical protein SCAL_001311 [Candidatus Syntrophoarchaeum caldarius]
MGISPVAIPIFNKRANSSADEYWRIKALTGASGKSKEQELDEIEKLLDKGIGGKLRDDLEKRANQLRGEVIGVNEASNRMERVIEDLLNITKDFAPNLEPKKGNIYPYDAGEGPIQDKYFKAINEILFGKADETIEFDDAIISTKGIEIRDAEADEIKSLMILNNITTLMQESAKKKLGLNNRFDNAWALLAEQDFAYSAFEVIVNSKKGLTLDEIQDRCHRVDQEYQELVRDIYDEKLDKELEKMLSDDLWEIRLIERTDGGIYSATEFGRWMWELCKHDHTRIEPEPEKKQRSFGKLKSFRGFGRRDKDKKDGLRGGKWKL